MDNHNRTAVSLLNHGSNKIHTKRQSEMTPLHFKTVDCSDAANDLCLGCQATLMTQNPKQTHYIAILLNLPEQ